MGWGDLLPWLAGGGGAAIGTGAGWALRLILIEHRKLGIDEREADQKVRAEASRLLMEIAASRDSEIARLTAENDQLRLYGIHALHEQECCRLLVENLKAITSEDWMTAARRAVDFLKRRGLEHELEGIELPSDMER